jgi:hypothetical protein
MATRLLAGAQNNGAHWQTQTAASVEDAKAAAIAAAPRYAAGVQAAISKNRFALGVGKIDPAAVRATILATPASAVADGIQKRLPQVTKAFVRLAPLIDAAANVSRAMPNTTQSDRKARMVTNFDQMSAIKDKYAAAP